MSEEAKPSVFEELAEDEQDQEMDELKKKLRKTFERRHPIWHNGIEVMGVQTWELVSERPLRKCDKCGSDH